MLGFFRRRKNEDFLIAMMKAAAAGEGKAQIRRAVRTLGMTAQDGESETHYSARATSHITWALMRRAGIGEGSASDDDLYAGGLFIFLLANHLTYILEASFEQAPSLGLLMFLTANGMDMMAAAGSNEAIANGYNQMSIRNDKYLRAIGEQFVKWTKAPSEERMDALTQLLDIGRKHVVA